MCSATIRYRSLISQSLAQGRGAYFKARYGGGRGRGRGRAPGVGGDARQVDTSPQSNGAQSQNSDHNVDTNGGSGWERLRDGLRSIDRSQYGKLVILMRRVLLPDILTNTTGAYKRMIGKYEHDKPAFTLSVDHVQADPYAAPSSVRSIMPWTETGFPQEFISSDISKIALCDFVTRLAADFIRSKHLDQNLGNYNGGWSGPKGGAFNIDSPGQEVLPRTSAMVDGDKTIELRFSVALPAAGRTVLGDAAWRILGANLVELVRHSLLWANIDQDRLREHIYSVERQHALRQQLRVRRCIAFVANGSILPRASGAAGKPMVGSDAIPFQSPEEAEMVLKCPDGSQIAGMGIRGGITMLTGGGFHGKSTLLEAIQLGVYNHIPGDGRELVVTDDTAVKIRAEDGRSVSGVDISPFISDLPGGRTTQRFSTADASGSTSMSANIQEALEAGCKTLLIDEDSSATNLLVRDQRMQSLIPSEPITPLISKARALFTQHGVSTIIVIGGLGDWLDIADTVIAMHDYIPRIITAEAKNVVKQYPSHVVQSREYGSLPDRKVNVDLRGLKSPYAIRKDFISTRPIDRNPVDDPAEAEPGIDLSGLEQIVEIGQARSIAAIVEDVAAMTTREA